MAVNPNDANSIKANFPGYSSWNDAASIVADYRATGGQGKGGVSNPSTGNTTTSGSGMTSTDPQQTIQAAIKALQEANKPAVDSLTASIPETQSAYATTRANLTASKPTLDKQYQDMLAEIKGNQTADVTTQTKATNATLAARGLSTQDAGAGQDLAGALQPINTNYANLTNKTETAQAGADQALEAQIADLTPKEQADIRAIQNSIAQLQSGAGTQGVSTGLNLYSTNLASETAKNKATADAAQTAIENAIKQGTLANQTKQTNYDVGKPYSTDTGTMDLSSLASLLGIGGTKTTTPTAPSYSAPVGTVKENPVGSGIYWTSTGNGWN